MKKRKVFFSPNFDSQFDEIYEFIKEDSPQNAEKFTKELEENMKTIMLNPEAYPPVTNFPNKTQRYRYKLFMKSFKIVYKCLKEMLVFVGILHKSQGSSAYKKIRTTKYE